jgi:hypothetical protein
LEVTLRELEQLRAELANQELSELQRNALTHEVAVSQFWLFLNSSPF